MLSIVKLQNTKKVVFYFDKRVLVNYHRCISLNVNMKTVCVSSSSRFADKWEEVKLILQKNGIKVFLPSDVIYKNSAVKITDPKLKKKVMSEFFDIIDNSDLLYLIALNGYTGISSAVEAGYAYAKGKEIISSEEITDVGIKPLVSKILTPEQLVEDINSKSRKI